MPSHDTASVLERLVSPDKSKTKQSKQNPNKVEVLLLEVGLLIIQGHLGLWTTEQQRETGKESYGSLEKFQWHHCLAQSRASGLNPLA